MFPNRRDTAEVTVAFPDCTITGSRGSDSLVGTSGADVICGTTALDSPDDPCREAAEELCWHPHRQYQGFSLSEIPDNPAEDFTCAAARVDI